MASISDLYETERKVSDFVDVPAWIEQDIETPQLASIMEGGCASGAYMPAVTYYQARETMNEHGDDVLEYISESNYGDGLPTPRGDESWSGIAVFYLSVAVELWAASVGDEIDFDADDEEE